ncbi:hypothetical protein D3C80_1576360 [compost metagenome]
MRGQYGLLDRELANEAVIADAEARAAATLGAADARAAGLLAVEQYKQQANPTNQVQQANIEMARQLMREGAAPEVVNAALNGRLAPQTSAQVITGGIQNLPVGVRTGNQVRPLSPEEYAQFNNLVAPTATR